MKKFIDIAWIFVILIGIMLLITGCTEKYENITVYINDGLSESKIKEIEEKLKSMDDVNTIQYNTKAEALEDAKKKMAENANLLSHYSENNHPFPASFTIKLKKSKNSDKIVEEIKMIEGVKDVQKEITIKDLLNAEKDYIKSEK